MRDWKSLTGRSVSWGCENSFLALIEDRAALAHLPAICSTSGVDVVALGPGDMALSMGIPGGWKDRRVLAVVDEILAGASAAGKPASIPALDPADGRALYAKGFQILLVSARSVTANAARGFVQEIGRS